MFRKILEKIRGKKSPSKKIVTRFPPSPTGNLHIGGVRTALFNYLYARRYGGTFLMRIEDTDKARSKKEFEDNIFEGMKWLGLDFDNQGEVPHQSTRGDVYKKYLKQLIDSGGAYVSKETPKEPGDREEVIRFKNPNKKITFNDLVRGEVSFDTTELGDFVVAKSLEEPIYHFAVVVDDYEMGVTHILRGEDHVSNTPRQILIQEALSFPRPVYAHIPLILAHDRSKLSKRHGAVSLTEYRDRGYEREAILNYLALLGWNPGTEQEIFSLDELVESFEIERVQKGGAIFSEEKLTWFNKEHLKRLPKDQIAQRIKSRICDSSRGRERSWSMDDELLARIAPAVLERIDRMTDIDTLLMTGDLDYYFQDPEYDAFSLKWKQDFDLKGVIQHLGKLRDILHDMRESDWTEEKIKSAVWAYAEEQGRGNVLWPYRFSLSGKEKSPNPFTLSYIVGKEITLRRLDRGLSKAKAHEKSH